MGEDFGAGLFDDEVLADDVGDLVEDETPRWAGEAGRGPVGETCGTCRFADEYYFGAHVCGLIEDPVWSIEMWEPACECWQPSSVAIGAMWSKAFGGGAPLQADADDLAVLADRLEELGDVRCEWIRRSWLRVEC